jgi:hypothetical protein
VWNVPEWWASHLSRAGGVPYIVSPRGMLQPQAMQHSRWRKVMAYSLLEHRNLERAALLHATSKQEADALRELRLGVRIAVVPNGVDLDVARRTARGYRTRLGIPPGDFVILFLGRMHRIGGSTCSPRVRRIVATHPSAPGLAGPDEQGLILSLALLCAPCRQSSRMDAVGGDDKWALLRSGRDGQCSVPRLRPRGRRIAGGRRARHCHAHDAMAGD